MNIDSLFLALSAIVCLMIAGVLFWHDYADGIIAAAAIGVVVLFAVAGIATEIDKQRRRNG